MSNNKDILRTTILVYALICSTIGKYNEQETLIIQTKQTTTNNFQQSFFPPNGDQQIMVLNYNQTSNVYIQTIYDFNGTIICERQWIDTTIQFIDWPLLTTGLYCKQTTGEIFKSSQPCDNPSLLHKFQTKINSWQFSSTVHESYGIFYQSSNLTITIDEYDLTTGNLSRSFDLLDGERVNTMYYSSWREFLFVQVSLNNGTKKVVVFDIQSLERLREVTIDSAFKLARGENSENRFLVIDMNMNIYSVNENGDTTIVFNATSDDNKNNLLNKFCNDDNDLITLRESSNNTIRLISYNTLDGEVIQNFTIDFTVINVNQSLSCNNQYLSLMDQKGIIHIFYTAEEPDDGGSDDSSSFPTWAIILIVIGSLMIIGAVVGFIIRKRKQKAGQYRRFSNQMIKPGLRD